MTDDPSVDLQKRAPQSPASRRHAAKRRGTHPVQVNVGIQSTKPEPLDVNVTVQQQPAAHSDPFLAELERLRSAAAEAWQEANQTRIMPTRNHFVRQANRSFDYPALRVKKRQEPTTAQRFAMWTIGHIASISYCSGGYFYCDRPISHCFVNGDDTMVSLERIERYALEHMSDVDLLDDHAIEEGRRIAREALDWAYGQLQADMPLPPNLKVVS